MKSFLVAGCTSDAGKSVVVAGLCRAFARRGIKVAPFKAQNMSNNSAVTPDGGEIGRAQALQACACGLAPSTAFNPILLKPGSDRTSQLVVNGKAAGNVSARNYIEYRAQLRTVAAEALNALRSEYEVVICEGAGSPAEINLRETDVANFGLAEACDLPVYLVGDIDRGGVLAHFFGTHQIVSEQDRARITGFIVNKFRGDQSILEPGLDDLEKRLGVPTVAVLPFIKGLWIDAEDSLQTHIGSTVGPASPALGAQRLRVAAVRLPRVSNATDVEALACEPGVTVSWTVDPDQVHEADVVILPGSKATVSDLNWSRRTGIAEAIIERARQEAPVLGICGGFQMMCASIHDPVESGTHKPVQGLGIFDIDIAFHPEKTLIRHDHGGYEVHHGRVMRSTETPWIGEEGAVKGACFGTHRHGYLESDPARREFLRRIVALTGRTGFVLDPKTSFQGERDKQLDLLADSIEKHWDIDALIRDLSSA
ncbi:cobyric acid synthase [Corynebacterium pseudotuberculosis]|uniref:Cobyric acid synthase n=1 Tax=Corynebacterium pseudotuberculosis (strain C231) TaxID=681645 RepID=D9QB42_CORP2|nr:cobyric acid synthase [Corynebacterium pseudotuberculosis]ADK29093.1 cobyric acid synthase [Corynebacterium pseudotuberculosis FRC41]ADL10768.1 cobyric acid synthase [Corynebacterium pseudotuberculosis C231]ADL21176.2 cobyric acid synthase [Corynebacterium pseudotuberculosis 1002]ADO26567.3 cobyric acid synthase [Corynebacterium pseudotuberculosis I19]AEX39793.1 Cobyric acid synthase [Corynebacterium pseudotuberculosis 3/99-5]